MTDEILEAVSFQLRNDHPVMAAMATKLERLPREKSDGIDVQITFDGPALPEKRRGLMTLALPLPAPVIWKTQIEAWLRMCEQDVAAAMKRAGLGTMSVRTLEAGIDRAHANAEVTRKSEQVMFERLVPAEFALQRLAKAQDRAAEVDGYDWSAAVDEIMSDLERGCTGPTEEMVFGV